LAEACVCVLPCALLFPRALLPCAVSAFLPFSRSQSDGLLLEDDVLDDGALLLVEEDELGFEALDDELPFVLVAAGADAAALTVSDPRSFSIFAAVSPAFFRSSIEAYGRLATIFLAVAGPMPFTASRSASLEVLMSAFAEFFSALFLSVLLSAAAGFVASDAFALRGFASAAVKASRRANTAIPSLLISGDSS